MKTLIALGLAAATLTGVAAVQPAIALTPNVKGVYVYRLTTLCPARQVITTKNAVTSIAPTLEPFVKSVTQLRGGTLRQEVGTINFLPTVVNGQSGAATLKATEGVSWLVINKLDGTSPAEGNLQTETYSAAGTYSMTANSLTLSLSGEADQKYNVYYGGINTTTGLTSFAEFVGFPGLDCTTSGSITRR